MDIYVCTCMESHTCTRVMCDLEKHVCTCMIIPKLHTCALVLNKTMD